MSVQTWLRGVQARAWGRRLGLGIAAILLLAGAVALIAPPFVRDGVQKGLGDFLQRPVSVGAIHINLLRLSASIENLKIDGRKGEPPLLEIGRAEANLEGPSSLFHRAVVIQSLRVERPRLYVARESANRYSISDILDRLAAQPKPKDDQGSTRFALYNLELVDGSVRFHDKPVAREQRIEQLAISVPFLSSIPADVKVFTQPRLSAVVNGTKLELGGKARPFLSENRDADIVLKLAPFDVTPFLAYLPKAPGVKLESAKFAADLELRFSQPAGKPPQIALAGRASALDWQIHDGDGARLLHFDALNVDLAGLEPMARKAHVTSVEWVKPDFALSFDRSNRIQAIKAIQREIAAYAPAEGAPAEAKPGAQSGSAWQWQVDRVAIRSGRAELTNVTLDPPVKMTAETIDAELKGLSSALGKAVPLRVSVAGDAGEKIAFDGTVVPQPMLLKGVLDFSSIQVARGAPYVFATIPGLIVDSAVLKGHVPVELRSGDQGLGVVLTDTQFSAAEVALRQQGDKTPFLKAKELALDGLMLDLPQHVVKLASARFDGPELLLRRGKGGAFDLERLGGAKANASAKASAPSPTTPAPAAWSYAVDAVAVDGAAVRFEDLSQASPLRLALAPLSLKLAKLDSRPNQYAEVDLSAGWNQKGRLAVSGKVSPQPLRIDLKVDGSGLDVVPLIARATKDYEVSVTRAKLSAKGQMVLDLSKPDTPVGAYKGNVSVADFSSIDLTNDEDFVRWSLLSLTKEDLRLSPLSVSIGEIALRDLQTRLILNSSGELNLREVTQKRHGDDPATSAPAPAQTPAQTPAQSAPASKTAVVAAPAPLPAIRIDRIVLSGAAINYSDRFVRPNFDARLSGMTGRLENLATDPSKVATIDLRGAVDGLAPLEIAGQLAPLRNDRFLDVKAAVKGYELSALSSYAGKYVGYGIERGKLSMDLRYKIEDRKLSAENHVFLDQLTFGDKVESADATKLPVRFAVNLLKNSRGEIDVNLPVGGTLDDPQFSVGGIIWNMILNFFGKVISSPFSFLAGGSGGGADQSVVVFTPGSARLDQAAIKQLEGVAKALIDRPALDLDLIGRADPLVDAEGLKRESFQRKMRSLKLQEMAKAGDSGGSVDEVRIDPAEYPRLLRAVYEDEKIPNKPRNLVGMQKALPVPDMERMLAANAKVSDEDVRSLALARANAVQGWLVESGKVPGERVFVLAPKLGEDKDKDKADAKAATSTSRVDFSLR